MGPDNFETAAGSAWVMASYGTAGFFGSLDIQTGDTFSGDSIFLTAATHVTDTLTVAVATKITMTYQVDGDVAYSTNPGTRLYLTPFVAFDLTINGQGYPQQQIVPFGANTVLTDNTYSVTATITPGTPFTYDEYLGFTTNDSFLSSAYLNAYFDYSHTAQLVSTVLTDDAGNPVSGAMLTSLSGFDYLNPQGPEPATWALCILSRDGTPLASPKTKHSKIACATTRHRFVELPQFVAHALLRAASRLSRNPGANHWKQRNAAPGFLPLETFPAGTVPCSSRRPKLT